jgi:hypothetical protein
MRHKRGAQQQEGSFFIFFQTALLEAQKQELIIDAHPGLRRLRKQELRALLVGFLGLHLIVCFGSGVAKRDTHAPE